eukprot:25954-Rhodomonas_salina.1
MIGPSAFKSVFNNTSATTHLTVRSSSIAVRSEVDGVLVACDAPRRGGRREASGEQGAGSREQGAVSTGSARGSGPAPPLTGRLTPSLAQPSG